MTPDRNDAVAPDTLDPEAALMGSSINLSAPPFDHTGYEHSRRLAALLQSIAGSVHHLAEPDVAELPWLQYLDEVHLRTFLVEYAAAYQEALNTGDWQRVDEALGDWRATAEALDDPELRRLLQEADLPTDERVPLHYPA